MPTSHTLATCPTLPAQERPGQLAIVATGCGLPRTKDGVRIPAANAGPGPLGLSEGPEE